MTDKSKRKVCIKIPDDPIRDFVRVQIKKDQGCGVLDVRDWIEIAVLEKPPDGDFIPGIVSICVGDEIDEGTHFVKLTDWGNHRSVLSHAKLLLKAFELAGKE